MTPESQNQISIKETTGSYAQASLKHHHVQSLSGDMLFQRSAQCSENTAFRRVISGSKAFWVSQLLMSDLRESFCISNLSLFQLRWKHSNSRFSLPKLHKSTHCRSYHVFLKLFFKTWSGQISIAWLTETLMGEMYLHATVTELALKS